MRRCGFGSKSQSIRLFTNHFEVTAAPPVDGCFYAYIVPYFVVSIKRADGGVVAAEIMRRKILDRVAEIYELELDGKHYAYDGRRSLFTVDHLFQHNLLDQLNVIVDDVNGSPFTYNVSIKYDSKIPMKVIDNRELTEPPEQFRVLDAILRHNAATQGYFFVGKAWFPYEPRNLNGGVDGYWGHCASFRATQGGLSLNIDASTALIISPGPLRQFLLLHQGVTSAAEIDCFKAKGTLKNLRIKATHSNMEYKISGLSNLRCREQTSNYGANSLLKSCAISISTEFTEIMGRVLTPPELVFGTKECFAPCKGKWNVDHTKLVYARKLERWAVVNFSSHCNMRKLCQDLVRCGQMIGFEKPETTTKSASIRVDEMISKLLSELRVVPKILLCILPEKKNCDLYGPWKRKTLCEQLGLNSVLLPEVPKYPKVRPTPRICGVPTLIVGLDVCHGSPVRDQPSIVAAVGSLAWPLLSRYHAKARYQSPNSELIEALSDKVSDTKDQGIFSEILLGFYLTSGKRKPEQIIIFSESQFDQVLNVELKQIIDACKFVDENWSPKFMLVVAQKRHHTRFFQSNSPYNNVPPGTVVDNGVCHPRNHDFYLCAHAGMTGTTRATRYHVLCDEIGCSADEIQEFVHSLSYVYQPSSSAISIVAPIRYAHRAAAQMAKIGQVVESDQLPKLHKCEKDQVRNEIYIVVVLASKLPVYLH
ncbi:hypothetical protein C2S53_017665 [Perilla frutescens var. hirtella]|uniref:Piwi domain-containing protein n=1 Tax=Perilla frutescens var. hirtella TaxID=608512 RepID=A0AAD4P4W1_PERFH|nr:hypothetical protein C2S53_017665 [Perilla frutescens var. hirtella]